VGLHARARSGSLVGSVSGALVSLGDSTVGVSSRS
jgi:hypothetical protein